MYFVTKNWTKGGGFTSYEGKSSRSAFDERDFTGTPHQMCVKHGQNWGRMGDWDNSEIHTYTSKRAYLRGDEPKQIRTWYKL